MEALRDVCHERTPCGSARADLQERLAGRDEFIGALGHELRNTIAPLVLLADHFEQLTLSSEPQLGSRVTMLSRNLRKLTATIDRLTEVASLRDGKLDLDFAMVDLRDVVDDVARELASDAARAHADLRVYYSTPVQGWWDRRRLKQVLHNLVSNAIRYGDGSPIEIRAQLRGKLAELIVIDQGPGVPVELRDRLFDRFDHRCATKGSGFGVGLFVVKALTEAMGGAVRLDESSDGARFCVSLPRA
jgi:signal transduction histidine kinase